VLYYYTPDNGDPGTLATAIWSAVWAESYNADTAAPTWTVTKVEDSVRTGAICVAADCMGSKRFAGDFISAIIDPAGAAHLTWMKHEGGESPVLVSIHYQRIQSGPPSIYQPPACGQLPLPVELNTVVSRKMHNGLGPFDVDLPVTGPHGIECRSGGTNGDYTLIFSFSNPLHSVDSANVTSGTGSVSSEQIDSADPHKYIVNLTGVANAQHLFVTLHNVHDEAGRISDTISAPMSVLIGDVNASGRVDSGDVFLVRQQSMQDANASNFRDDITASGRVDSGDVFIAREQTLTSLP
jgi:hypothetical protein